MEESSVERTCLAEIDHVGDGHGHGGVEGRHDDDAQEIEHRRHDDRLIDAHGAGAHHRGDGVGCVRPAVDKDHAQRQQDRYGQRGAGRDLLQEKSKRQIHVVPPFSF